VDADALVERWGCAPLARLAQAAVKPFVDAAAPARWEKLPKTEHGRVDLRGLILRASSTGRKNIGGLTFFRLTARPAVTGKELRNVDLSHAALPYLAAENATFEDVTFSATDLTGLFAPSAIFRRVAFERVRFDSALAGVYMRGRRPEFTGCSFVECSFEGAVITDAIMKDCTFDRCKLQNRTRFEGVDLRDCRFESCTFREVVFSRYNVARRQFEGLISSCNFNNCSLIDCGFYGGVKLTGITSTGNEILVVPERHIELLENLIAKLAGKVPPKALERFVLHLKAVEDTSNMTTQDGLPVPDAAKPVVWVAMKQEFARMLGRRETVTSTTAKKAAKKPNANRRGGSS
jgi:uncharacterized protein YjbI with pentapeptide repeats